MDSKPVGEISTAFQSASKSDVNDSGRLLRRSPRPSWIRARLPGGGNYHNLNQLIESRNLHTVCKSANCPNVGECWEEGTATFLINGNQCTRSCRFCNVKTGRRLPPPDGDEPRRVAEAAEIMKLDHVVVTSVTRDDLPDGGAGAFAAVIRSIRERLPRATIEVLIPDFQGLKTALEMVFRERPDVLNHNVETVRRLYPVARPEGDYQRSLGVLRSAAECGLVAKSGFMIGMGERREEIQELLEDLRGSRVRLVTIGQYLSPTPNHLAVARYVPPEEFEDWVRVGGELGFDYTAAAPLVRSSYHARQGLKKVVN